LRRAQWHVRLLWDYLAATTSVLLRFIVAVFRDPEQLKELEMLRCEYALAVSRASGPTEKLRLSRMVEELNLCIERLRPLHYIRANDESRR
jgi:hypothetical protein